MTSAIPVHPGSILNDEFLMPRKVSIYRLAVGIGVPSSTLERFRNGDTAVTEDLAQRLADYFDTDPEYWMNYQRDFNSSAA